MKPPGKSPKGVIVIGLETSCDETGASVVQGGQHILSNIISSQADLHAATGGVVPEVASRRHVEQINAVIAESLKAANVAFSDLDAVAVANRPGLLGALLVGVSAAKAISYARQIPLLGIHHIEAHIYANFLVRPEIEFPLICLVASGGHSEIFLMRGHGDYAILGRTRDDAAGEAFDKSARLLGLGYPGGIEIDRLAKTGNPKAIPLPRAWLDEGSLDFSFSGLKTAVRNSARANFDAHSINDWAASVQEAIVDVLVRKTIRAAKEQGVRTVLAAGGVSANSRLQETLAVACAKNGLEFIAPPPVLCTDNAAMIACAGYYHLQAGLIDGLDLDVLASERLV
ncbi:MAG TPA: tRNA (adenosine(37)-N6)-threonylcarbamoyltransferase complex transferase subunit TsaD [Capsulimonadaceae bacterium]|nr:tRNA (adenosine(37)-N6)-threonylcarbamoyltransferase complex transferase subunit TsaD [Capsulimonadaceae bacterium]